MNDDERNSMKTMVFDDLGEQSIEPDTNRDNGGHREYPESAGYEPYDDTEGIRDDIRGRDATRVSTLMASGTDQGAELSGASIPLPDLRNGGTANASDVRGASEPSSGAMTLDGYQRIRKGYERGINPDALERMEERQVRQFPPPAPSYAESTRLESTPASDAVSAGRIYEADRNLNNRDTNESYPEIGARPKRRRFGPVAVALLLFVGIVGGLLLYVGGADLFTGMFRSGQPAPEENLTLVTERPRADAQPAPVDTPAPGEALESEESEPAEAGEVQAASVEESRDAEEAEREREEEAAAADGERERVAEARKRQEEQERRIRVAEEQRRQQEAARANEARAKTEAAARNVDRNAGETSGGGGETPTVSVPSVKPISAGSSEGAYVVQVRATTDKAEADRIARALRSKGGEDVHIVVADKNGETLYRVRFGSFDSADGAKQTAGEYGFKDVWIVKR